jgi:hypothetical protein
MVRWFDLVMPEILKQPKHIVIIYSQSAQQSFSIHFGHNFLSKDLHLLTERYAYHCGWVSLRPSDSDFGQNWKPEIGEIPLLSLWLGTNEAQ